MKTFLILAAVLSVAFGQRTYELDLKKSIDRIQAQITVSRENPAQWSALDRIMDDLLDCIADLATGMSMFQVKDPKWMSPTVVSYIEGISVESIARGLKSMDWSVLNNETCQPQTEWNDLKRFMGTAGFVTIHNHLWGHPEFLDMIKFLYNAKYDTIYASIKQFYVDMGRQDLGDQIPSGPDATSSLLSSNEKRQLPQSAGNRFPAITFNPPTLEDKCSIANLPGGLIPLFNILDRFTKPNIHHVLKIFLYTLQEVFGNSAMHVLLLKLGESHKGELIHSTLALPEMQGEGLLHVKALLLNNAGVCQLNEIVKQVLGLDLGNCRLFEYVVNLLQFLVWNYPFPDASVCPVPPPA